MGSPNDPMYGHALLLLGSAQLTGTMRIVKVINYNIYMRKCASYAQDPQHMRLNAGKNGAYALICRCLLSADYTFCPTAHVHTNLPMCIPPHTSGT